MFHTTTRTAHTARDPSSTRGAQRSTPASPTDTSTTIDASGAATGHRHGLGHLLDCLCPRRGRGRDDAGDIPLQEMVHAFAPPPGPLPPQLVTALQDHEQGALYRFQPPGFPEHESLLAFDLPGVQNRTRYHECQNGLRCGLHTLNMLAMAMAGNDYRVLASRGELDAFVQGRKGGRPAPINDYRLEDLRDFHNTASPSARAGGAALGLVPAVLQRDGSLSFAGPQGAAQAAAIDAADAVGLSFDIGRSPPTGVRSVLVCRNGPERYEIRDARSHLPRYRQAASMSQAVAGYMAELGQSADGNGDGAAGVGLHLLFPTGAAIGATPATPRLPESPLTRWF